MPSYFKYTLSSLVLITLLGTSSCQKAPDSAKASDAATDTKLDLKTDDDKTSYAMGIEIGHNILELQKRQIITLNADAIVAGFKDSVAAGKPQLSEDDMSKLLQALNEKVRKAEQDQQQKDQAAQMAGVSDKNIKAGTAYLDANKSKDGVKVTASGLQYKVVKKGSGAKFPTDDDTVLVNYKGTFVDGTVFDASEKDPVSFPVKGLIPGMTEALKLMKEGDKFQIAIPGALAYGTNAQNPQMYNATLLFDVELVKIAKPGDKPTDKPGK